ncbi:TolC family protein [Acinetobacter baumannii]|jgi:cobalt-zinc-cadmium efflux system outer membrane protein|uniref:TolC family protein n=1 Tax=Acinetobacter TaxID=469 RepID=UPI0004F567B5|nr:TolC family protein [Acinetobacter baumannii]EHU1305431.1 TolC family protein [Acinetobacter baumannii]EHU2158750.1 TolC family protein [Acinetobacter baumannii]EHU2439029.1 TolC family protein [Acinetobacter baumannii]EIB6850162.1 TolC family protein [Acinetobacter baumannii]EJB8576262.1 TolC family protein [Acinetobacter baumannii]
MSSIFLNRVSHPDLLSCNVKITLKKVVTISSLSIVMLLAGQMANAASDIQQGSYTQKAAFSFEQALARAQSYQTQQGVWQAQQQMAEAQLKQSRLWANPSLSIEQTGLQSDQEKELAIGISQPLDIFGQRKAAQHLAKVEMSKVDLAEQRYKAELELIVKYFWSQVALLELEKSLIGEQLAVSQENLSASEKRYQAGSIAQVDVDRVRMSHLENQRLYQQVDLKLQVAKQQLANLWGGDSNQFQLSQSSNQLWVLAADVESGQDRQNNLLERSFQLDALAQQATIQQLKAKARPQPAVTLGVNNTRSPEQRTENQIRLGVEIPLNLFNRQQYGIKIAQAKQELSQRQQSFYRQQNQVDIETLMSELKGLHIQFKQLNDQQVPLAVQVQQKTLQGFRLGKFAVTDVQQATMQLQDVRLRKVELLKQAWQNSIEIQSLRLGLEPEQIMAKDALMQLNQRAWQQAQAFPTQAGE